MDVERTKQAIAVMQAFVDGKTIQLKAKCCQGWSTEFGTPQWDCERCDYRVKPEPVTVYVPVYTDAWTGTCYRSREAAMANNVTSRIAKCVEVAE